MPVPKGFRERKIRGIRCAAGSHRIKILSRNKRITICCPSGPGHWKSGRCRVGTRATAVQTRVR